MIEYAALVTAADNLPSAHARAPGHRDRDGVRT